MIYEAGFILMATADDALGISEAKEFIKIHKLKSWQAQIGRGENQIIVVAISDVEI